MIKTNKKQTYEYVLNRVINDGIKAVEKDYTRPEQLPKLEGSIAGFEACRDKTPSELRGLLEKACDESLQRRIAEMDPENYWWARCYELEVEWVCNVISAAFMNSGLPIIIAPTARGVMKAAEILGVSR